MMINDGRRSGRLLFYLIVMTHLLVDSFVSWQKLFHESVFTANIKNEISHSSAFSFSRGYLMMSTRQANNLSNQQIRKKQIQPLITSLDRSRIMIGGQRWILPGDYVVHEEYGIGRCTITLFFLWRAIPLWFWIRRPRYNFILFMNQSCYFLRGHNLVSYTALSLPIMSANSCNSNWELINRR